MAFARDYTPAQTLKILNESEGQAGTSGELAHAFSRHLRNSAHGGVGKAAFAARWETDPYDDNTDYRINSGWLAKGDMAVLLCRLLNSPIGQAGLHGLDGAADRVCVNGFFKDVSGFGGTSLGGAVAELRALPQPADFIYHDDHPKNPLRGQLKTIKTKPMKFKGVIRMKDIVGAVAVLDKMGTRLHVQTFYPLFTVVGRGFAEYRMGTSVVTKSETQTDYIHTTIELRT
ncbi:MAG: hypothetical protein H6843_09365 [Rhodospirillaceae bacterium]|nr:hypothetical protein [Rhodospirillaceae bacterium]